MTYGAGERWGDVYPVVFNSGKIVVGGAEKTVGAGGGWVTGGGQQPLFQPVRPRR